MPIPLPPLEEQHAIADEADRLLAHVDDGREDLARAEAQLAPFVSSVLHAAFYGDLADGPFPERALGEACDVKSGIGFPKEYQGRASGAVPFAKVRDISRVWSRGDKTLAGADHFISADEVRELRGKPMPPGTVVMAKIGEAVRLNRRAVLGQTSLVDNNVMGWVPRAGVVLPDYLYYFSRTVDLGRRTQETAVPSVRKTDVVLLAIPTPGLEAQRHVIELVERQLSAEVAIRSSLEQSQRNADRLRASIFGQAIIGELVAPKAGDRLLDALAVARLDAVAAGKVARKKRHAVLVTE